MGLSTDVSCFLDGALRTNSHFPVHRPGSPWLAHSLCSTSRVCTNMWDQDPIYAPVSMKWLSWCVWPDSPSSQGRDRGVFAGDWAPEAGRHFLPWLAFKSTSTWQKRNLCGYFKKSPPSLNNEDGGIWVRQAKSQEWHVSWLCWGAASVRVPWFTVSSQWLARCVLHSKLTQVQETNSHLSQELLGQHF